MSRTSDRRYQRNRRRVLRNSDTCWLCGHWINHELKWPDPYSASADHVVPIKRGGRNDGELRAAHLRCNQSRKAGPPPTTHSRAW